MSKRNGVSWVRKEEPKFIREFKERIAYKEQSSVETKKRKLDEEEEKDAGIENEDETPQVVQLKEGDLTRKEYEELKSKQDIENSASSFGKILFKKPVKVTKDESQKIEENESEEANKKKTSEIDMIFNLDKEGKEKTDNDDAESKEDKVEPIKQINAESTSESLNRKRFVDNQTSGKHQRSSLSAIEVRKKEQKESQKKMLSFYDLENEDE